ncbi:ribose-phosphate pyrophosphokinase [Paenibacillus sp. 1182]|uniref:ribose-phosphate pyrophosphokinase n=1 Tax=Paenibacillus sp. 1182 TaxID=2806565 RepID=UPI001AE6181D|nr:ribose-phosphate pyrophosphokinase [Paenibacillus sp. 1182]MBP1308814.1 ribose-phosphate pyrophosphokinase [Paenibacillus sp. 1182]
MILMNGIPVHFTTFPNGETKVDGSQIAGLLRSVGNLRVDLTLKFEDDGDLIKLLFVKEFMDELGLSASLLITYMPYSRMDRQEGNSVFTLKSVARFINQMKFDSVTIIEPHSDVTPALVDRSRILYPTLTLLKKVLKLIEFDPNKDYIYFPDAGAAKRYGKGKELKGFKQLVGHKSRDFETGKLEKLEIVGDVDRKDYKVLIIDDLCSFGGTFSWGSEKLREKGAFEVYLLVTHCEESIYQKGLLDSGLIQKVFTTNTMLNESKHKNLEIIHHF